jgi:hypothetical protein
VAALRHSVSGRRGWEWATMLIGRDLTVLVDFDRISGRWL